MKIMVAVVLFASAALALLSEAAVAQTAEELFQKGVRLEEVKGELEQAIDVYKSVVNKYSANQSLAAKSLLRMGKCYEKLGKDGAKKAYERIIKEYASQPDAVSEARARLAVLTAGTKVGGSPSAQRLLSDNVQPPIRNPRNMTPSPDGRWLAYTQGEVYIRNLETDEVKQVVPGEPAVRNRSAVWSADGRRLAFWQLDLKTKIGAIRIHDLASGEEVTVLNSGTGQLYLLDWSRDGRYLLCNNERNTLELVTIKDGTMKTLSDSVWQAQRASFSPDGRFVTYASGKHGMEIMYTQMIAGGPRHRIAEAQRGQYLHPLWSPDGSAIAYQQADGIWVVPVTNGVASGPAHHAFKTDIPRWAVTWTDAGGFYLTYNAERFHAYEVRVDPTTGQPVNPEAKKIPDSPNDLSDFAWAPDAQHIVYTGWDDKIRLYAIDTKTMTTYGAGPGMHHRPARSKGSREVLFESNDPATRTGVVRALDMVSGKTRDLFPPMQGFIFSLGSDGHRLAYMRGSEVIVGNTDDPAGRVVAAGPMEAFSELSPQGDRVLYVQKGGADPQNGGPKGGSLWVVGADSSGAHRVASAAGITSAVWDPSGRFIAYLARPESGTEARSLRIVDVATGAQLGNVLLPEPRWGRIQLTDWSGDGRSIGFFATEVWWEYWVVRDLQEGGK